MLQLSLRESRGGSNPLQPVQESFHEVDQVQQEKEKLINEAWRDYSKVIPLAEGNKVLESRR